MKNVLAIAALAGLSTVAVAGVVPTTVADFGVVSGSADATATIPAFGVDVFWISFEVAGGTYVDITTSLGSVGTDTEIGLFDSSGNLLDEDDDDGIGRASTLTYGTGSGMSLGDLFELDGSGVADGSDGAMLTAGTYYVAFGGFDTTFSSGFGASSTFFDFDDADMTITVLSNAPAPGSLALLGLGGMAISRRRR